MENELILNELKTILDKYGLDTYIVSFMTPEGTFMVGYRGPSLALVFMSMQICSDIYGSIKPKQDITLQ